MIAKEVLSENTKKVRNLDTEIEGYKQSVQDEEDTNEKNTVLLNRVEHDIEQAKRKIDEAKKEQVNSHSYVSLEILFSLLYVFKLKFC